MAVIACSLQDGFSLPHSKGPLWYGIGASTVERGFRELRDAGLILQHSGVKAAPLSDTGWTTDMRYVLLPPLGPIGSTAKGAPEQLLSQALAVRDARTPTGTRSASTRRPPSQGGEPRPAEA